jgi:hypothetical protein
VKVVKSLGSVDFVVSRGGALLGTTGINFHIKVGRAALEGNFDVTSGGPHYGKMLEVNVKLSLCLTNEELRHEGVWGSRCIDPHFPDLGTRSR